MAIENRYGLKYWAGCMEDHLGAYFKGLEGYVPSDGVKTFSKNGLKKIFAACGENRVQFFYPYPDYKFPVKIFSDDRLPRPGELSRNLQNLDADRLKLFDEAKAFDTILQAGLFPEFSNSFLVRMRKKVSG